MKALSGQEPTPEQSAVIAEVAKRGPSAPSVMIEAGAGCAKTSTLQAAAPGIRVPALALAFNRSIAGDMKKVLPGNFTVQTLNALGHGAWGRSEGMRGKDISVDARKLGKLVTEVAKRRGTDLTSQQWEDTRTLVEKAMQEGLVPEGAGPEGFLPDSEASWLRLASDCWIGEDEAQGLAELAREVLVENIALARAGVLSFDDQIYCPTLLGGSFPAFPVLVVDEDQDLSMMNHAMLAASLRPDGRIIAVGDRHQAIYGFRGASGDSAEQIRKLCPEWTDLFLMTTFRCPQLVVERQQAYVPGYRAARGNALGVVTRFAPAEETPEGLIEGWGHKTLTDALSAVPRPGATCAVLCRNNAPLLSLAFKLIRQRIGVVMLGRDIGKGLVALSRKIVPDGTTGVEACVAAISKWKHREAALAEANGHGDKVSALTDRAECLLAVLASGAAKDAAGLRTALQALFERTDGLVTLGSIHRAKGLEWDVVLHLDPWRVPSKQAKEAAKRGDRTALRQEYNLRYVCETRTKHTLLLGNLEDFY